MTVAHEAVAAIPISGAKDPSLLRGLLVGRSIYLLGSDDPEQFVAVDPDTGDVPDALGYGNTLFWYDAADSTTAHDGVACLVSSDGKRFKISADPGWIASVLDKDTTAEPGSPTLGDAYLIPAAATGTNWAGHDDDLGIYTARGWLFIAPQTGRLIYVEDEESFYRYTAAGAWTLGIGIGALGSQDVTPANLLHGQKYFVVENQTTTSPPSPAAGTAYIVGGSATGDWSGKDGQVAVRNKAADGWVYVTPTEGLTAYDKGTDTTYVYSGSAWAGAAAAVDYQVFTANGTWTKPGGVGANSRVVVEMWGGGGGGGGSTSGGGGGGGGYRRKWFLASDLGSTETVTVGAGGTTGSAGGNSTFGSATAYGGGAGGSSGGGGGGGGVTSAGSAGSTNGGAGGGFALGAANGSSGAGTGGTGNSGGGGGSYGDGGQPAGAGGYGAEGGGGGGGGGGNTPKTGGNAALGAGGGGGIFGGTTAAGGTSVNGGAGGAGGSAGTAPGGGGGGNAVGARGEVRVTTFR